MNLFANASVPMEDDQTLAYYNVKAESNVYLRVRGDGGRAGGKGNKSGSSKKRLRGGR